MARATATMSPAAFSTFGDLLRYLRRRQRLTQIELAIAVGYSTAQISRLEQNLRRPNPSTLQALFVPMLGLEDEPELAARLIELALAARDQRDADAEMPDPESAVAVRLADQEPSAAPHELKALDATPSIQVTLPGAQVLVTKLYLPRPRPDRVARPRLLARLDAALHVPLTLVSAPAGFGKTTLLAAWLDHQRLAARDWRLAESSLAASLQPLAPLVAWLSLDDGDNDPSTFLRYLIAAVQTIAPEVGSTTLALLQTSQPPGPETLLRVLLNDLAALRQESLLALDDYHLITTPAIHAALAFLVEHLPPQLHLILASREDPSLPLARLRAQGQLVELRAIDLRFTLAEAATFLTEGMGLPLTPAQVAALETRTEGWIAGLQLAALAMRDRSDLADFLSAFTGSNRFIVEYLVAEVFVRQPPHLQAFLLQTSVLDRMCGPLCDAVLGLTTDHRRPTTDLVDAELPVVGRRSSVVDSYSQLILAQLERANLFLAPLDDERRWFRYHHLFGEALRQRLISGATEATLVTLHRRASAWYAVQGLVVEAVHHALAAQDWERAARLIEEQGLQLMLSGQVQTVLGWLNALPVAVMQRRPILIVHAGAGLMFTNQVDAAEVRLYDAERGLSPDTPDELARLVRGRVALCRGIIRCLAGDQAPALQFFQQAIALLPETAANETIAIMSGRARAATAVYAAATAYQLTGDVTTASERRAAEAIAPARATGYVTETLHSYTSLAYLQVLQGRLRTAAATYAEVERLVSGQDALQALIGSPAYYFGMGDLLREWNDLDAAAGYLARGMELVQGTLATEADVIMRGYLALARVQQAQGNGAAALATLDAFMRLARERQLFPLLIERAAALRARLQLLQGDLPAAIRWADGSGLSPDDDLSFPREAAYLTLVRVRIAAGQAAAVAPLLGRLLADAEASARMHSAIEIFMLQALAYDTLADRQCALTALAQALALAEPEGYVRSFVDEGAPLAALLRDAATRSSAPGYVERLLVAFPRTEGPGLRTESALSTRSARSPQSSALVEPLSERELEVLRMVAAGRSNRAIAQALMIEVGTVKRHVHSLLGKLAAQSRTEAVARARALQLL